MSNSTELYTRALAVLPGGVNSPVRSFRSVGGDPFFVKEAHGAHLTTTEDERLIDYVLSWGALILGHDHPAVREAVQEALARGTSFGITCPAEVELAELVAEMVPSVKMVRFVTSGTEATMAAVRLARAATGRDLIVKFDGSYHGHADGFLVSAGSGMATLGLPHSPGVPADVARLTLTAPFNDISGVETLFTQYGDRIATVIVEPFLGNAGFIPPIPGFLEGLREITRAWGALLIFDEVMTGFRVHPGGAQALTAVKPDLTTLGKVIGGGLPVGAFGGSRELMEMVAPAGAVYQAGTLSGNPLTMSAGLAALRTIRSEPIHEYLERRTRKLVRGLAAAAEAVGLRFTVGHAGAMWGCCFHPGPVTDVEDVRGSDTRRFSSFHRHARRHGVFLPPSPFEACFVSAAHTDEIIEDTIERLAKALAESSRS